MSATSATDPRQASPAGRPLAGLAGTLDGPLFALAPNGEIVSWDSQASELFGYTADDVIGRSFFDLLVDGEGTEPTRQAMAEALAGGESWGTVRLRRADGRPIEVKAQQVAMRRTSRHPAVIVVRAHDPDLDQRLETLFGSDQRQEALLEAADHLDLGLVVTVDEPDAGPVFAYVNQAASRILGREAQALVGSPIREAVPEDALHELMALRDRADSGALGASVIETEIQRPDGTAVPVEAGWGSGELHGAPATFAFFRDIRDRHIDAAELDALRERASEVDRLATSQGVVTEIAQELRSSITEAAAKLHRYRGQVGERDGQGRASGPDRQAADDLCRSVLDSLQRAEALVRQTDRSLSEASDDLLVEEGEASPFHEQVARCLHAFEAAHPAAIVERHLASSPTVDLRGFEIEHLLVHLLTNAAEAADGPARLKVRTRPTDQGVELVVEDDGPGIPADERSAVFEPFHTTKEGSLGLGLTMVQALVEKNRGSIEIDSRPVEGTTVTVALPTADRQAGA